MVPIIRDVLNYLTVAADILIVLVIFGLVLKTVIKNSKLKSWLQKLAFDQGRKAIVYSFVVATVATLGSLFFSEVAHFEPCKLCWLQRIFMYPMSLLFLIALIRKEKQIVVYGLVMSIIGAVIAAYNYFLQVGQMYNLNVESLASCSTVGYSPSCSSYFILSFGYITIPMMSLSAFVLIILLLSIKLKSNN